MLVIVLASFAAQAQYQASANAAVTVHNGSPRMCSNCAVTQQEAAGCYITFTTQAGVRSYNIYPGTSNNPWNIPVNLLPPSSTPPLQNVQYEVTSTYTCPVEEGPQIFTYVSPSYTTTYANQTFGIDVWVWK